MDNQQLVIGGTNIAIGDTNPLFRRRRSQREAGQASLEQLPNVHNRSRIIGRIGKIIGKGSKQYLIRIHENNNGIIMLSMRIRISQSLLHPMLHPKGFVEIFEIEASFESGIIRCQMQMESIGCHDGNLFLKDAANIVYILVSTSTGNASDMSLLPRLK